MKRIIFVGLTNEQLDKIIAALDMYLTEGDPLTEHLKSLRGEK